MTGVTKILRCGTCHYGKIVSNDLTKRICFGAPPSAIEMPAGPGQMTLRMVRPVVSVTDDACALYHDKSSVDIERDSNTMKTLQRHPDLFEPTKQ